MSFVTSKIGFLETLPIHELQLGQNLASTVFSSPRAASPVRGMSPVRASSPVRIRNRSPVRKSKNTSIYINSYSVHEITTIDSEHIPEYFLKTNLEQLKKFNIETNIDFIYDILDIYMNLGTIKQKESFIQNMDEPETIKKICKEATIIFKVRLWGIHNQLITEKLREQFKSYKYIVPTNIHVMCNELTLNSEEAVLNYRFRVCVNLDWNLLTILGKNTIYFEISINKLSSAYKQFYESFRYQCKNEPILNDMFMELAKKFEEETKRNMSSMMADFLDK